MGSTVGIVAPGRKVFLAEMNTARSVLTSWGIHVVYSPNLFSTQHHYLAGTDQERLSDLQRFINDDEITAILCARGGFGTTRILDQLDFSSFYRKPKWIVGFSDITALHLKLFAIGFESVHSTMPILFGDSTSLSSIESLKKTLFGKAEPLATKAHPKNILGNAAAQVVGGNLSLMVDALGTSTEPNLNGCILIIEEIDEYFYKIDRMLTQLKRAGKLANLAGLVVGHMTGIKETSIPFGESVEDIVLSKVSDYSYPVAFNFPIGHENPNLAWCHGSVMHLQVTEMGATLLP